MRITLNLATRPFADLGPALKRLRIAMGVLAVVALALGLGLRALHQKAQEARDRDHSLDGQIAGITRERQGYQDLMRQPDNSKLLSQTGSLNQIFDEKSFSWTLAIENLETVLPSGVQVSALEPVRAKDGQITLHLRVIGPRDHEVELVRNLEHSRRFLQPRIVGENAESTSGPNQQRLEPISASNRFNFDLLAEYNPPTQEERRPARVEEKPSPEGNTIGRPAHIRALPGNRPPYTGQSRPPSSGAKPDPAHHRTSAPPAMNAHPTPGGRP
jgi:type IV pilus assembly protein PilN